VPDDGTRSRRDEDDEDNAGADRGEPAEARALRRALVRGLRIHLGLGHLGRASRS
jgi:hypothetical protein